MTIPAISLKRGQTILTPAGPWEVESVRVLDGYGVVTVFLKGEGENRREETLRVTEAVEVKR